MTTEPPSRQPPNLTADWRYKTVALATFGLAVLLCCSMSFWQGLVGLGNCTPDDSRSACEPLRIRAPVYGAGVGLALAATGCWVWPKRLSVLWLALGYGAALGGFVVAFSD